MSEVFKVEQPKKEVEAKNIDPKQKKRVLQLWDEDQIEVKKLILEDMDEVLVVLKKCAFEVTQKEVLGIIAFDLSFGCYVNRMLIGVGLAWPAYYNSDTKKIAEGDSNSIYFEDPAVILAYEGRGIRRILLREREKHGKERSFQYALSFVSEDTPKDVSSYIKEGASQLEKLYLSEGYSFFKTKEGLLAVKIL